MHFVLLMKADLSDSDCVAEVMGQRSRSDRDGMGQRSRSDRGGMGKGFALTGAGWGSGLALVRTLPRFRSNEPSGH